MANGMQEYENLLGPVKRRLFADALRDRSRTGPIDLLEAGIGVAPNLQFYDSDEAVSVTGLDPNPWMLEYAREAGNTAGFSAGRLKLVRGDVLDMPFADSTFDVVVCTLLLCSVEDPQAAVREMQRVLRPGGHLLFVEHVLAPTPGLLQASQRLLNPLQRLLADNCHLTRRTGDLISNAGFQHVSLQTFVVDDLGLIGPHCAGLATL